MQGMKNAGPFINVLYRKISKIFQVIKFLKNAHYIITFIQKTG